MYVFAAVCEYTYLSFSFSAITAILGKILVASGKVIMALGLVVKCLLIFCMLCSENNTVKKCSRAKSPISKLF